MEYKDTDVLKVVEGRLAGVQQRKESLMKFVKTLETEEEQLLSLRKTYKENQPLYDLIQDEPNITESAKTTSQYIQTRDANEIPESKEGRARKAILIILQENGALTPLEIYNIAKEFISDIDVVAIRNAANRMMHKGILKRDANSRYSINHEYK
jgi:predicted transcriptional regulator of viral defense system